MRKLAASVVFAAILTAAPATAEPAIDWGECPPDSVDLGQECTTVSVPMDYAAPAGDRISLAVSRIPAARPELRRGVLLLIPGGPGNPGLNRPWTLGARLPQDVKDRYDIIGFDPRGTGRSNPISCELSYADVRSLSQWPAPNGDISENVAKAKRFADACVTKAGPLLRHVSTQNEVRDIDQIRKALGQKKISYWAHSYGTYVGAVYATLFAGNTDRVLLDSNDEADPETLWRKVMANQAIGVDDRFPDFAEWASRPGNPHRVTDSPAAVRPLFLDLAARLDRAPIGEFTGNTLREALLRGMNSDAGFPLIAQTMIAARDGGAPPALPLPPESVLQNTAAVAGATICNDVAWPRSIEVYQRDVLRLRAQHPLSAGLPGNIVPCAFWPYQPDKPVRVSSDGPSNILMLQSARDPASPLVGALQLRHALGHRAKMVTVGTGGHGVYLQQGNVCGDNSVTAFLVTGQRPVRDVYCAR
ncbi:alpha/beta hydrolase [Kibdelosporangium aridum]|uniref:alpha/beta hydrolase n=1 Tax=Kibdelosporangium aridum TaxID=2030 RepID=UPI0005252437